MAKVYIVSKYIVNRQTTKCQSWIMNIYSLRLRPSLAFYQLLPLWLFLLHWLFSRMFWLVFSNFRSSSRLFLIGSFLIVSFFFLLLLIAVQTFVPLHVWVMELCSHWILGIRFSWLSFRISFLVNPSFRYCFIVRRSCAPIWILRGGGNLAFIDFFLRGDMEVVKLYQTDKPKKISQKLEQCLTGNIKPTNIAKHSAQEVKSG